MTDNRTIKAWSFSALKLFEKCPYAAKLRYLDKQPGPDHSDDDKHPLVRGTRIHLEAEEYVNGTREQLPTSLKKLSTEFEELRTAYEAGEVKLEEEWAFDVEFEPCAWFGDTTWLRVKTDVMQFFDEHNAKIIDHKTGKKYGNEVPHMQQGQLYAVTGFILYPKLNFIEDQFWYLDEGKTTSKIYTREKAMKFLPRFVDKGLKMTTCTNFPAKPNAMNCKFCDYGVVKGTGECAFAVEPL